MSTEHLIDNARRLEADWGRNEGEAIAVAQLLADALEAATSTIDRIDTALRGDGRSAMLIVTAQEIINQYREGQERD